MSSRDNQRALHPLIGTGTSYHQITDVILDKERIVRFADAVNVSHRNIFKDDCGQWTISGKHGHVQTWGDADTYLLYLVAYSSRIWGAIKRNAQAIGWELTQDGDSEGCFKIGLPVEQQSKYLRQLIGLRRSRN
jgi:hypothetical protein